MVKKKKKRKKKKEKIEGLSRKWREATLLLTGKISYRIRANGGETSFDFHRANVPPRAVFALVVKNCTSSFGLKGLRVEQRVGRWRPTWRTRVPAFGRSSPKIGKCPCLLECLHTFASAEIMPDSRDRGHGTVRRRSISLTRNNGWGIHSMRLGRVESKSVDLKICGNQFARFEIETTVDFVEFLQFTSQFL